MVWDLGFLRWPILQLQILSLKIKIWSVLQTVLKHCVQDDLKTVQTDVHEGTIKGSS